jgi:hypothetical protein
MTAALAPFNKKLSHPANYLPAQYSGSVKLLKSDEPLNAILKAYRLYFVGTCGHKHNSMSIFDVFLLRRAHHVLLIYGKMMLIYRKLMTISSLVALSHTYSKIFTLGVTNLGWRRDAGDRLI